jgi:6-phosphogluconate dehydrogenase
MESKSAFGVFGLGVMGSSISLNIADKGFSLSVYNRAAGGEEAVVKDFMEANAHRDNLQGFTDLKAFIKSIERPRKILIMIKAGPTVDLVLNNLIPLLSKGDIIIDGGNSHYLNTKKRFELCKAHDIEFIGSGVSGGEAGARRGPSIMPGGSKDSYAKVSEVLEAIAAKDDFGKTCCAYIGPEGSGHFIKMVHNGIEYVEMQLLAELYALMRNEMSNTDIADVFESWNKDELSSYLLEITAEILRKKEGENFLLDLILDKAGNKGTGSWSSKAAFDLGIPNTMMSEAVFARYISSFKESREKFSKLVKTEQKEKGPLDLNRARRAYEFARLINHQQGFKLMEIASDTYQWNLNFSEIARIWSNGCIIKSQLMNRLHVYFKKDKDLFNMNELVQGLGEGENSVKELIQYGLGQRVALHCFSASYYYWIDMTTKSLPANLIQAQRDFFGAHTYQRVDKPSEETFHTEW